MYHIRRRKTSAYTADAKKSDGDGVNVDVIFVEKRLAGVKCDNGYFSIVGAPECSVSVTELGDYTVAVSALTAEFPEFIEVRL